VTEHEALEPFAFETEGPNAFGITSLPTPLFTENETNIQRLFGSPLTNPYVKDAFHEYLIHGRKEAVNPALEGTKAAFHYKVQVPAQGQIVLYLRLASQQELSAGGAIPSIREEAEKVFEARIADADAFYASKLPKSESKEERLIARQAYAGLLWSKQFYYYCVKEWQEGDPTRGTP
jgi:hypothetical protein